MPVLAFITTFERKINCKNNWKRYFKYIYVFMQRFCSSFKIVIKSGFSQQNFEKY